MKYEEAYEYLKQLMGCANKTANEECMCTELCTNCEYDYDTDKWEDAISTAIEALEKQVTMRATASFAKYYECPKCGELLETVEPYNYCWHCGQRISQSEVE